MQSYRRDPTVTDRPLAPGTRRRVLAYARPYRRLIGAFLGLLVLSSFLVVLTPLLLKRIVDEGVSRDDRGLVVAMASLVAVVAVADAALSLVERWLSARIGEGLIYDLRTEVFGTCCASRSRSSPGPRPARWSPG
jgi:ATP-binding cassette subfamily B protein